MGVEIFSQRQRISPKTMNKMGDKYSLWEKGELMSDAIFEKNCIFMMVEKMPSATGEFLRQVAFFISYNGCLPGCRKLSFMNLS